MIAHSTLQIMNVQLEKWDVLSLADQIKLVRKRLIAIHPDHNHNDCQHVECSELIEYYKYLRKEDNQYLKTYLPESESQDTESYSHFSTQPPVYSTSKPQKPIETAQNFFSDFKESVRKTFNNDWSQAYNSIFIVKREHQNQFAEEDHEPREFISPYQFHILKLAKTFKTSAHPFSLFQGEGSPQESDFDRALAFIYYLIRFEHPSTYLIPTDILPPIFLKDEKLSLKIHSFFPGIINIARSYGFQEFWQDERFWLKAIVNNPKVFDIFNDFSLEDKKFLTLKLARQFNDKTYMKDMISRNPIAVHFLSDSLKYDVELLTQAIGGLSYLNYERKKLFESLPQDMRSIDSPLAANVLNDIDLGLLAMFENTNPGLYFKYMHQACCTLNTTLHGNYMNGFNSERSMFVNSLPEAEQAYAKVTCRLIDKLSLYQVGLSEKMQSQAYCFFPYKLKTYTQAIDELKKFLEGNGDIQNLNRFLPHLYSSSLKSDIEKWLSYQTINPTLQDIEFEPQKFNKLYELLTSTNTHCGLLFVGYIALLCQGVASVFLLSAAAVLCLMVVQKLFYDNDDRHFIQPSF